MIQNEKENLLIIGASGHGKVVADIALKMNKWEKIAFIDDDQRIIKSLNLDILGNSKKIDIYISDWDIFVAVGNNKIRQEIQEKLELKGATIATLVHPSAILAGEVILSKGTVVMAGVIINSSTIIGKGCIINTGSTVDHDNFIEDYVHISPGVHLAGGVHIGEKSWLGIGSLVRNNIEIVKNTTLGAGTVVVKNIINSGIYIGIPARSFNDGKDTNFSK